MSPTINELAQKVAVIETTLSNVQTTEETCKSEVKESLKELVDKTNKIAESIVAMDVRITQLVQAQDNLRKSQESQTVLYQADSKKQAKFEGKMLGLGIALAAAGSVIGGLIVAYVSKMF